jgi:nucleotide-binding universal stress UspA family protein
VSFERILIAVNGEPIAAHAADVGADLARSLAAQVALIYVVDSSLGYGADTGVAPHELIDSANRDGKKLVSEFRLRLSLQSSALDFVQAGSPSAEIVKAAREWPADLIVIGSHGRSGFQRALLGSVAEEVMRHASCPVLVVRSKT